MKTKTEKRKEALVRLEAQLESGVKTIKGTLNEKEPLTDKDITRIKQTIVNLKAKI